MVRYELKYAFEEDMYDHLLNSIKSHPAFFREIYYRRQVNSIYFDTSMLSSYYANINGLAKREKQRIRWYGDCVEQIEKPHLEIKRKSGLVGDKININLPNIKIPIDNSWNEKLNSILAKLHEEKPEHQHHIKMFLDKKPAIANSYKRRYFITSNKKFRLTIDHDIKYHRVTPSHFDSAGINDYRIIVELKYDMPFAVEVEGITKHFNWRIARNSKYVNAVNSIYFNLLPS